jgi:hypothetical protein
MRVKLIKKYTKRGEREYRAYVVSIPKHLIEGLEWHKYDYLELQVKPRKDNFELILTPPQEEGGSPER